MITRTKLNALPVDERKELEAILAAARAKQAGGRFESNADEASFVFYMLFAGSVLGLVAYLIVFEPLEGLDSLRYMFTFGFNPRVLINPSLGALLLVPIGAYSLWRIIANFRGNGWALTSFGFVHVYRGNVRIVRFADVTKVDVSRFYVGSRATRRRATSVTLHTRDGTKLQSYAGALLAGLRQRLPAGAPVVES